MHLQVELKVILDTLEPYAHMTLKWNATILYYNNSIFARPYHVSVSTRSISQLEVSNAKHDQVGSNAFDINGRPNSLTVSLSLSDYKYTTQCTLE